MGLLAQLVQSTCLTSRGSLVRIQQGPHQAENPCKIARVFHFCTASQTCLDLRRRNEKQQSGFAGLGFLFVGAGIVWIMSAASNPAKLARAFAGEMKNNNPALPD